MNYGPKIVTSGLVLALDAADRKSYSGSGTAWNDLSGNNNVFTLSCVGTSCTNPTFTSNSLTTNYVITTPFNFSYINGSTLTSTLLNLLYSDHTIEIACKINSLLTVFDRNNALTNENVQGMIIWPGYHSGLYVDGNNDTLNYAIWNSTTAQLGTNTSILNNSGNNIIIHATRLSNVMYIYINGSLRNSVSIASPTNYGYTNLRIGGGNITQPTANGFSWATNITYYSIKLYTIGFTQSQVTQNFNAQRRRFDI